MDSRQYFPEQVRDVLLHIATNAELRPLERPKLCFSISRAFVFLSEQETDKS